MMKEFQYLKEKEEKSSFSTVLRFKQTSITVNTSKRITALRFFNYFGCIYS